MSEITREVLNFFYAVYRALLPFGGVIVTGIIVAGLYALYCDTRPQPPPPPLPPVPQPDPFGTRVRDADISVLAANNLLDNGNPRHQGDNHDDPWR